MSDQLSDEEKRLTELVRETLKDSPPFEPCVFYHEELDETHVILRDCSYYEGRVEPNGVRVLRDNYDDRAVIGLIAPGRLRGVGDLSALRQVQELQERVTTLEQRNADCHDIIGRLWAITDPEVISELSDLPDRIHQELGANDPDGHCGNAICARLAEAESTLLRLQEGLKQYGQHADECELQHAEVIAFEPRVEDMGTVYPVRRRLPTDPPAECTCGLSALLGEVP